MTVDRVTIGARERRGWQMVADGLNAHSANMDLMRPKIQRFFSACASPAWRRPPEYTGGTLDTYTASKTPLLKMSRNLSEKRPTAIC